MAASYIAIKRGKSTNAPLASFASTRDVSESVAGHQKSRRKSVIDGLTTIGEMNDKMARRSSDASSASGHPAILKAIADPALEVMCEYPVGSAVDPAAADVSGGAGSTGIFVASDLHLVPIDDLDLSQNANFIERDKTIVNISGLVESSVIDMPLHVESDDNSELDSDSSDASDSDSQASSDSSSSEGSDSSIARAVKAMLAAGFDVEKVRERQLRDLQKYASRGPTEWGEVSSDSDEDRTL